MVDFADALGASKAASALLVLFIPSKDRRNKPINQRYWVRETLDVPGTPLEKAPTRRQTKGKKRT